jgi:hypothetical protein
MKKNITIIMFFKAIRFSLKPFALQPQIKELGHEE